MRKLICGFSLILVAGCGSTSTEASGGNPTPTPVSGDFCGSFQVGPGLACDNTTNPPTLKVVYGTGAGTVAQGNDPRLTAGKGKYLGVFSPTATNAHTSVSPGGILTSAFDNSTGPGVGQMIYNSDTGRVGLRAADEICAAITDWPTGGGAAIPTAHACSTEELVYNVRQGNIPQGQAGMAYVTASAAYLATADSSWKATCGNWTYNSADLYRGTRWDVAPQQVRNNLADATKTLELKLTSQQPCNAALPVACCQ